MEFEEGDIVLCTVDRIIGTNVFVRIDDTDKEGVIVFSEVAPGRIRNIRDYIVPKKKIVCKILRISGDRIDLSFRRVTQKEQKEIKEKSKLEKSYESMLRSFLGNTAKKVLGEISSEEKIYDFIQRAKEDPKELEKLVGKENAKKIVEKLKSQKQKKAILKKELLITSEEPEGIEIIKNLLNKLGDVEIRYISAGRYSLKTESSDIKKADQELSQAIDSLEKEAKTLGVDFSILKK